MSIQLPLWGEEPPRVPHEQDFSDMLYAPVPPPEPNPEMTPEQQRAEAFFQEALPFEGENFANDASSMQQAGRDLTEVCVMTGWPPRHVQVGLHCPHGLLDDDSDEVIDLT